MTEALTAVVLAALLDGLPPADAARALERLQSGDPSMRRAVLELLCGASLRRAAVRRRAMRGAS